MIQYEGHEQFMKMLYYIEQQMPQIDLTIKKADFKVDGKIARERKFDLENIERVLDTKILTVEDSLGSAKSQGSFARPGNRSETMPEEILPATRQNFFGFFSLRKKVNELVRNPLEFYD